MSRKINFKRLCTSISVPYALIRRLRRAGLALLEQQDAPAAEVSIILADDDYIHSLNKEYRHKDTTTDVLSFGFYEASPEGIAYGDIFISLERVNEQAKRFKATPAHELARLCLHGILHLCGHDHPTQQQEDLMNNLAAPYLARFDT